MLIKEYRIPMPLTVEEYKIAQLYMIAKKSREESQGTGSGVEIIQNEPYTDGPGGSGQYTYKIYHVGHHLPSWLKALLPKSALTVEEKAWNAYPYTKTRYTCPFIEKFSIEIETKYFDDCGHQTNVFNLPKSELNRQIDYIDIVEEQLVPASDCNDQNDDPRYYISTKTKRGPLSENWIREYWNDGKPIKPIMCAYKLCRVEFKYWGMQNKIERFIHESALRKTMLKAHQQAWVWQDEWVDLTMDDIRRLELETQEYLKKRMADQSEQQDQQEQQINDENKENIATGDSHSNKVINLNVIDKDNENNYDNVLHFETPKKSSSSSSSSSVARKNSISQYLMGSNTRRDSDLDVGSDQLKRRKSFQSSLHSPSERLDIIETWRIETLARNSESSDDEFYDAEDINDKIYTSKIIEDESDDIFSTKFKQQFQSDLQQKVVREPEGSVLDSPQYSPTHQPTCPISTLIIILHGGNVLDMNSLDVNLSKSHDINTFKTTMESIIEKHYSHLSGRIAIRYVACPPICHESLLVMLSLSPYSVQSSPNTDSVSHTFNSIPISALPLFAVSSFDYHENIIQTINECNKTYQNFLKSDDGKGFNGKVCLIGDSIGSILGFDALCTGSQNSIYESQLINDNTVKDELSNKIGSNLSNPMISINDLQNSSLDENDQTNQMNSPLAKSRTLPMSVINQNNGKNIQKQLYSKSFSHPGGDSTSSTTSTNRSTNRLYINSVVRRRSSGSSDLATIKFDFEVEDFFMFGSMIGVVLTYRKLLSLDDKSFSLMKPACGNLYNLFHLNDPSALRLEPLLSARFSYIPAINVARYQKFPLGDGQPIHLLEYLQTFSYLFSNENLPISNKDLVRRISEISLTSNAPMDNLNLPSITSITNRWWGTKRIDYALYSPEGLNNFPTHSLPHLFHSSYWESSDVISFILRQINKLDLFSLNYIAPDISKEIVFKPKQSREKWQRKRTSVKLKNVNANHRANDVIVKEGLEQVISGRFMYGPLDFVALTGEKVDIHMLCPKTGQWNYLDTGLTDKTGRVHYTIPKEKALPTGLYHFKMVVRGDHTFLDLFMAVVPPKTEAVVFSIDGSLTASLSVSAKDPKVRAGAIDVVRFWQELGYLIVYITGRPDIQQQRVVSWLYQHNFPHGLIFFVDGFSTEPLKHKTEYLKTLSQKMEVIIRAAYGSSKDISVYQSSDLKPEQIYIVGKVWKKQMSMANIISDGYAVHLEQLRTNLLGRSNCQQVNSRVTLPKGAFTGLRSRHHDKSVKRTISYPITTSINNNNNSSSTKSVVVASVSIANDDQNNSNVTTTST
ncbi:Membrane-associated phosphatidylinositol transfer protein 2 [Dermatophagoides pteronyssinus]|uniref:Membrane-associated phosphatidylinositol transfer protein 2 n=1 Tax=Dermatophagoides pteronyssinus TaxID=6956 RepID=A0ABQ8JB30_DERPT|nr:Membrane-associated phosphatidylinositol transfer protein 2 [Dermatophagoides pteronyssinus]